MCWQSVVVNYFSAEGYSMIPKAIAEPLNFPARTPRELEVLVMSLFYNNNLLNSSLHSLFPTKFLSPMCECGKAIQDAHHILVECGVDVLDSEVIQRKLCNCICELNDMPATVYLTNLHLLNASKGTLTLSLITERVKSLKKYMKNEINL